MTTISNPPAPSVAVLGLGPMGRALAEALRSQGHQVIVWNRTPGRADELSSGIAQAPTPEAALAGVDMVVVCVRGYAAVADVLGQVSTGAWQGKTLVNLTSGTAHEARDWASWAERRSVRYLDGAILTPTTSIGTPSATVLVAGSAADYGVASSTLAALGSVVHIGEQVGLANSYDVALLDFFSTSVHGLVHAFALAGAEGVDLNTFARFATGIGSLLPEMATRFAHEIEAGESPGARSTIASAATSLAHITDTAARHGIDTEGLDAMRRLVDRAIGKGFADSGLSRLAAELAPSSVGPRADDHESEVSRAHERAAQR